jgi:hypothetical protein
MRLPAHIDKHAVVGDARMLPGSRRFAWVQIDLEKREVAARNLEAQPVAAAEPIGDREQFDLHRRKHSRTARHREDYNAVRFATAARDWVADGFGDLGYDIAGFHQSQMRRHSRRGEAIEHGDVVHARRT